MKKNSKKRHLKAVLLVMLAAVAVSAVVLLNTAPVEKALDGEGKRNKDCYGGKRRRYHAAQSFLQIA